MKAPPAPWIARGGPSFTRPRRGSAPGAVGAGGPVATAPLARENHGVRVRARPARPE
jgi:hypothetical protein